MVYLEKFSDIDRTLLVSLPYRAALSVAQSDKAGSSMAGLRETVALENIIEKKAREKFESPLAQEIIMELSSRRNEWPNWAKATGNNFEECRKAVAILADAKADARDRDAYSRIVMDIAGEVASAFREFDVKGSVFSRAGTRIRIGLDRLIGLTRGETYESEALLKVSYEEDVVLARLAEALGLETPEDVVYKEMAGKSS